MKTAPAIAPWHNGATKSKGCLRQIGRELGLAHTTVGRYFSRIGRLCLLHHQNTLEGFEITESIAVDGFESFEYSQYFPCHFHLATGRESWFLYHFTDSPLRRKGRMTKKQKKRRVELESLLGRPDPKAIEKDMMELIGTVVAKMQKKGAVEIHCDEHRAYPRAVRRLRHERPELPEVILKTISSKAPRTARNPLFSINRTDLLIRHCSANHKRETIAFSKLRQRENGPPNSQFPDHPDHNQKLTAKIVKSSSPIVPSVSGNPRSVRSSVGPISASGRKPGSPVAVKKVPDKVLRS